LIAPVQTNGVAAIMPERPARTSSFANALIPNNDPAPEARKSLAPGPPTRAIFAWRGGGHPEASNAKPEGWVGHKVQSSPVGATPKNSPPCLTDNLFPSSTLCPQKRQVSGHEFTRAVKTKKNSGFSPCSKFQGLKAKFLVSHTARLKSCPDTCLGEKSKFLINSRLRPVFLRVSAPPRCAFIGAR
jgi:hypothetical protein